jgi:hypothetical protein
MVAMLYEGEVRFRSIFFESDYQGFRALLVRRKESLQKSTLSSLIGRFEF